MTVWQILFSGASVESKRIVVHYELSLYQTPRKYIQQMRLYLRKKKAFKKRYTLAKIFRSAVTWQQRNILETAYVKHRATLCQSLCHCYSLFIAPLSKLYCLHTLTFWRNTEIFKCEVSDYSDFKRNVQTWSTYLFGLNDLSTTWERHDHAQNCILVGLGEASKLEKHAGPLVQSQSLLIDQLHERLVYIGYFIVLQVRFFQMHWFSRSSFH